jgi:hypothetical protein
LYYQAHEQKPALLLVEFGLSGTNGKEAQAVGYKDVAIKSGYFSDVIAMLGYVICDKPLSAKKSLDSRLIIHGIPDAVLKSVEHGLSEEYYKILKKGIRVLRKKNLSRGKDLYNLLTMDGEQVNAVGDNRFTYAQGLAFEAVGRTLLAQYLPKCADPIDLLRRPYGLSIKPDLAIEFDSKCNIDQFFDIVADAWCFSLQRKP